MAKASLNVLHGVYFLQSHLWTGSAARLTSGSVQDLISQGKLRRRKKREAQAVTWGASGLGGSLGVGRQPLGCTCIYPSHRCETGL